MDIFELLKRKEHLTYVHYTYCSTLLSILCTLQVFTITLHFQLGGGWEPVYDLELKIKCIMKLDGVGPVDNRPFTDKLHHFDRKKKNKKKMTRDM